MNEVLPPDMRPGMGQRVSDWLVVPLSPRFHVGDMGIDSGMGRYKGVVEWEKNVARQVALLDRLCVEYLFNVWRAAGVERGPPG